MKKSNPAEYAEVTEYIGSRLKRNKKRLQRLQGAARIVQGGFRAYLARMFVRGIRRRKAASKIQRAFRGWIGRCDFLDQARRIWGTQVIQRSWRGYLCSRPILRHEPNGNIRLHKHSLEYRCDNTVDFRE